MTHDPKCPQRECDACAWDGKGCCRGECRCEEYAANVIGTVDGVTEDEITEFLEKL